MLPEPKENAIIFTADSIQKILAHQKTQTRRVAWTFDIHHELRKRMPDVPIQWAGAVFPARESGWVSWYPGDEKTRMNGLPLAEFTKKQYAKGIECPYGKPGDRLYVKETWSANWISTDHETGIADDWGNLSRERLAAIKSKNDLSSVEHLVYAADDCWKSVSKEERGFKWHSPMFMPSWASRLMLEITDARPERLQAITDEDAIAEGVQAKEWTNGNGTLTMRYTPRSWFATLWDEINGKKAPWESNPWVWCIAFRVIEGK